MGYSGMGARGATPKPKQYFLALSSWNTTIIVLTSKRSTGGWSWDWIPPSRSAICGIFRIFRIFRNISDWNMPPSLVRQQKTDVSVVKVSNLFTDTQASASMDIDEGYLHPSSPFFIWWGVGEQGKGYRRKAKILSEIRTKTFVRSFMLDCTDSTRESYAHGAN